MRTFFVTILIATAAVLAFNLRVDLSGRSNGDVSALAGRQTEQDLIVAPGQYDQRSWVRARLLRECPRRLILGSSTMGTLTSEMFAEGEVMNGFMGGPGVEDLEAVATLLERQHCVPEQVMIGVDPFFANPSVRNDRWRTLEDEQRAFSDRPSMLAGWGRAAANVWAGFKDGLSWETTRDSVKHVWSGEAGAPRGPRLTQDLDGFCRERATWSSVRHADGHFSYCDNWLMSESEVAEVARTYVERDFHSIRRWDRVSAERLERLGTVVEFLRDRGSSVTLAAPIYHPLSHQAMHEREQTREMLRRLDRRIDRLAAQTGAAFVNFREDHTDLCAPAEFYDSHHANPACAARMARLLEAAAR